MLCGVTATLGSNPSATATAARPHWGRAVLLCLPDLCARSLGVPVGGGPPARSPHASLRLGVVDLEARPGPAATHRHRDQAPTLPTGVAARALRSLRRPPHQWCQVSDVARCVGLLFGQATPPPVGVTGVSCVEFLGWSGVCCYKRRQSDGFLAENGRYRSVRAMTSRKSRM